MSRRPGGPRGARPTPRKLAILVGGGPAPGINSVIGAATIRACIAEVEVIGIEDGFSWLIRGDLSHVRPLTIEGVSRIHFRGGSHLGISRRNPTATPEALEATLASLLRLGVTDLITIGGDDTAFSAMKLSDLAGSRLRIAHVPKTIDNDLDLSPNVDTFGFQTARHVGVEIVKNLMVDAKTTRRWYYVIAMGRKAGHLALGIGKAVGATLTLIPEEFPTKPVPLRLLVDTLVGAHVKRLSTGRHDGVALIAEGVSLDLDPAELGALEVADRDEHGHVRLAEINIGEILRRAAQAELARLGIDATIVDKNIGYELRCADPIPFDMEYTRDLGYCATKFLLEGGRAAMVSLQAGHFVAVPFESMLDPRTGRARLRLVDIHSTRYAIARRYMIRLRRDDFEDASLLARHAEIARMTPEVFRRRFEYLVADEPPALRMNRAGERETRQLDEPKRSG